MFIRRLLPRLGRRGDFRGVHPQPDHILLGLSLVFPRPLDGSRSAQFSLLYYVPACLIFVLGISDDFVGAVPI